MMNAVITRRLIPGHAWPWLAVGATMLALQATGDLQAWRMETGTMLAEPWRLLTAHLVHVGWSHLGMNLAGTGLAWLLFGRYFTAGQWCVLMAGCAAGVNIGLAAYSAELAWYAGFSGVLHGLLGAGAIGTLRAMPVTAGLVLAGLVLKIVLEQSGIDTTGSALLIGAPVAVDAHLYGALAGAVVMLGLSLSRSRSSAAPR